MLAFSVSDYVCFKLQCKSKWSLVLNMPFVLITIWNFWSENAHFKPQYWMQEQTDTMYKCMLTKKSSSFYLFTCLVLFVFVVRWYTDSVLNKSWIMMNIRWARNILFLDTLTQWMKNRMQQTITICIVSNSK